MVQRRADELGMKGKIGCHVFWATGITAYLEAGGTLENAQAMAANESPRTTKPTPRPSDHAAPPRDRVVAGFANRSGDAFPKSRTQRHFLIQIGAAAADYRTGEKAVGT